MQPANANPQRRRKLANISKVSSKNKRKPRVHYLNNQLNLGSYPQGKPTKA
jgi:hypothetical protein